MEDRSCRPYRIAYHLGLARPTVGRVLARYSMPRLTEVDQATGLAVRYEKTSPGELVHLDINKLGRVPDGGGWRAHGRGSAPTWPRTAPRPAAAVRAARWEAIGTSTTR